MIVFLVTCPQKSWEGNFCEIYMDLMHCFQNCLYKYKYKQNNFYFLRMFIQSGYQKQILLGPYQSRNQCRFRSRSGLSLIFVSSGSQINEVLDVVHSLNYKTVSYLTHICQKGLA